jgi:ABC-type methionine transport system permease subunit
MKAKSIGYLAALIATTLAANAGLAPNAAEVVKLAKSGVSEDVATAYVRSGKRGSTIAWFVLLQCAAPRCLEITSVPLSSGLPGGSS